LHLSQCLMTVSALVFHQELHTLVVDPFPLLLPVSICSASEGSLPVHWACSAYTHHLLTICMHDSRHQLLSNLSTSGTSAQDNFSVRMLLACESRWSWYTVSLVSSGSKLSAQLYLSQLFLEFSYSFFSFSQMCCLQVLPAYMLWVFWFRLDDLVTLSVWGWMSSGVEAHTACRSNLRLNLASPYPGTQDAQPCTRAVPLSRGDGSHGAKSYISLIALILPLIFIIFTARQHSLLCRALY